MERVQPFSFVFVGQKVFVVEGQDFFDKVQFVFELGNAFVRLLNGLMDVGRDRAHLRPLH